MKHFFLLLCAAASLFTATTATSQLANTWKPYGGPYHKGGNFYDFTQLNDGTLFAASAGSGVYRSTDDGRTWQHADSNLKDLSVVALAAAPDGTILAVTLANSVFASTNKGVLWEEYPLAASGSFGARNVVVTPQGTWLVATSQGIYRSTDKGANFAASNTGITETSKRARAFVMDSKTIYAAVRDRIYRSNDDGQTWVGGTATISDVNTNQVFDMAMGATGELYFTGQLFDDIFISVDSGNTMGSISFNLPFVPGTNDLHIPLGIATDQQGNLYAGLAERGVFMLEPNNSQWVELPHGALTEGAIWSVFASKTGTILAGTEHNMFYKLTSANWEVSTGKQFSDVQNLWKKNSSLLSLADGRLYNGLIPMSVSGSDARITFMEHTEFGSLYAGSTDTLWKSSYGAESWNVLSYPDSLAGHFDYIDFASGKGLIALACNAYAGQFKGKSAVFLSNTDGTTWLTASGLPDEPYSVLALEIDDSKTLWALTTTGVYSLDNTFGATWNLNNTGLPQNTVAEQIVSNERPFMNDNLFILAAGRVYSYDGSSWSESSQLPTGTTIRRLIKGSGNEPFIAGVTDDNSMYMLTSSGVFHGTIPPFPFRKPEITCAALDLMIITSNNTTEPYLGLFVGTAGMGIYYVEQDNFGSVAEYRTTGTEVFPDPARERISITVEKTRGGLGQLEIFDPLGTSVLRLEREMNAGKAVIGCDISALPSGIYGYRLTLPDGVYGGRFAVIR